MELKEEIKKEIYNYVFKQELNEDEIKEIDNYVISLLEMLTPVLEAHRSVLENKDSREKFKKLILDNIEEM